MQTRMRRPVSLEPLEDRTLLTAWTALGPAPLTGETALGYPLAGNTNSGRVTGIAADPSNANTIYLATAGGGVWKTTDANDASPNRHHEFDGGHRRRTQQRQRHLCRHRRGQQLRGL
jgi:hypothetical protein